VLRRLLRGSQKRKAKEAPMIRHTVRDQGNKRAHLIKNRDGVKGIKKSAHMLSKDGLDKAIESARPRDKSKLITLKIGR
jgi:hypothetical protein